MADENVSGDSIRSFGEMAETLSKASAIVGIAIYAFGYLIVSLYHSTYGFALQTPFRPKIVSAGAWFAFITSATTMATFANRRINAARSAERFEQFAANVRYLWWQLASSFVIALSLLGFFDFVPTTLNSKHNCIVLAASLVGFIAVTLQELWLKETRALVYLALIILPCVVVYEYIATLFHPVFTFRSLFLGIYWIAFLTPNDGRPFKVRTMDIRTAQMIFALLGTISLFARIYYPRLNASWGGGSTVPIVIYLSKDAAIHPSEQIAVELVDETDTGFFVAGKGESKAVFIPRSSVSLVVFAKDSQTSTITRTTK